MKIRLMHKNDFKGVYDMWKQAKLSLASYAREKKEFEDMVALNPKSCFVAIYENKVIGSIFGAYNGRRAFIYHLAVHPLWQHKGLGRLLLRETEKALKKRGLSRVRLRVDLDNLEVVPFYEKCGYSAYEPCTVFMGKDL